jgi:hypothetical protein
MSKRFLLTRSRSTGTVALGAAGLLGMALLCLPPASAADREHVRGCSNARLDPIGLDP